MKTKPGRPKLFNGPTHNIGVCIEDSLYWGLMDVARVKTCQLSAVIRDALRAFIRQKGPPSRIETRR